MSSLVFLASRAVLAVVQLVAVLLLQQNLGHQLLRPLQQQLHPKLEPQPLCPHLRLTLHYWPVTVAAAVAVAAAVDHLDRPQATGRLLRRRLTNEPFSSENS